MALAARALAAWLLLCSVAARLQQGPKGERPLQPGGAALTRNVGSFRSSQAKQARVVPDPEPIELIFTADPGNASKPFAPNPKNGTPWFRFKKVSNRGESSHKHFGGLRAHGDFKADVLAAHNVVRQRAGLAPLNWSDGLAELASGRASELARGGCYIRHSPLSDRWQESGFTYVGENLYKVVNMEPTGVDVVDAWYAEVDDYNYGPVGADCTERCAGRAAPPCTLGHFTQVMWADTTDVGCALERCPGAKPQAFVALCSYGPGGNIVGRSPFSGQRASALGLSRDTCTARQAAERQAAEAEAERPPKGAKFRAGSWPSARWHPALPVLLLLAALAATQP